MEMKFPVATIARELGVTKGNVSKILNRKLEPSETFLKGFYDKVYKSSMSVSRETSTPGDDLQSLLIQLMKAQNTLLATQNKLLDEQKENLASKMVKIESTTDQIHSNVSKLMNGLAAVGKQLDSRSEAALHSLERIEKIKEGDLLKEAGNILIRKGRGKKQQDNQISNDN